MINEAEFLTIRTKYEILKRLQRNLKKIENVKESEDFYIVLKYKTDYTYPEKPYSEELLEPYLIESVISVYKDEIEKLKKELFDLGLDFEEKK